MTSFATNIPVILEIIESVNPKKILDIGSGFGKFGILARELYLSVKAEQTGDILPVDDLIIDCAEEAKYFYNQPYHNRIYSNHWHGDVMEMTKDKLESYDLILLIDVVEHWDKEQAKEWLKRINTNILISTPRKVSFYKKAYYNSRKHISQWEVEDFEGTNFSTDKSLIFLKQKKNYEKTSPLEVSGV